MGVSSTHNGVAILRDLAKYKDKINRNNRNMLQYGAAIAGLWAIIAGSDGVLSIAKALLPPAAGTTSAQATLPGWAELFLNWGGWVGVAISVPLIWGLLWNFVGRWRNECQWEKNLAQEEDGSVLKDLLKGGKE